MSSPFNSPTVNDWFQRLDAAWKRMPEDERTRQREEVQQHLEGLVAAKVAQGQTTEAAWKAALAQFGDPTQIGRNVYQEWRQSRTGFRAETTAILFGFGLQMLMGFVVQPLDNLWFKQMIDARGIGVLGFLIVIGGIISWSGLVLINAAIGRKYPLQAIKGAFYGDVLWNLCYWIPIAAIISTDPRHYHSVTVFLTHSILWMPAWLVGQVIIAYLASVTKRGWYRPTVDDFKLTLPKLRRRAGTRP